MSAIDALPIVIAVEPAMPARNRNPISMSKLELTAQAIVNTTKRMFETWYIGVLPYNSESGAMTSAIREVSGCRSTR